MKFASYKTHIPIYNISFDNDIGNLIIKSKEKLPDDLRWYIYDNIVKNYIESYNDQFYKTKDPKMKDKIVKYMVNFKGENIILNVSYQGLY